MIKAPCGEIASLRHFKTCQHEECKHKLEQWNQAKKETAAMFQKFLKRDDKELL